MRQLVHEMTTDELQCEVEFWEFFYAECAEIGQGISSKEVVRKRAVEVELFMRTLNENTNHVLSMAMGGEFPMAEAA